MVHPDWGRKIFASGLHAASRRPGMGRRGDGSVCGVRILVGWPHRQRSAALAPAAKPRPRRPQLPMWLARPGFPSRSRIRITAGPARRAPRSPRRRAPPPCADLVQAESSPPACCCSPSLPPRAAARKGRRATRSRISRPGCRPSSSEPPAFPRVFSSSGGRGSPRPSSVSRPRRTASSWRPWRSAPSVRATTSTRRARSCRDWSSTSSGAPRASPRCPSSSRARRRRRRRPRRPRPARRSTSSRRPRERRVRRARPRNCWARSARRSRPSASW